MDNCSYFIEGTALFGCYPTQEFVDYLQQTMEIDYFIDLTEDDEKNFTKYTLSRGKKINYPIQDKSVPDNIRTFSSFILTLLAIINNKNKMYIHCRGGHGRSGIVVACLMKMYYKIDVDKALGLTYECHQKRRVMREKWRHIGSPQTIYQKNFVRELFIPICYNNYNKDNNYMSNFYTSPFDICINNKIERFYNAEACYQAFKNESDDEYVSLLKNEIDPKKAIQIGLGQDSDTWDSRCVNIMENIVREKFTQNKEIRDKLLATGLGEIIKISERTTFWNYIHYNRMGSLLTRIRNEFYK